MKTHLSVMLMYLSTRFCMKKSKLSSLTEAYADLKVGTRKKNQTQKLQAKITKTTNEQKKTRVSEEKKTVIF